MVMKMAATLLLQQALVVFAQMQPVMDPFVVKKSRPHAYQQFRGCKEVFRYEIKSTPQQPRDRQAVERMNQKFLRIARVPVMIEVKFEDDPPHPAVLRSPVEEKTMQKVLQ